MRPFVIIFLFLTSTIPAQGHEFWIETEDWQIAPKEDMRFSLRIGSDFSGFQHVYIPHKFTRFEMVAPQSIQMVDGRIGDRPAGQIPARQIKAGGEGLYLIRHETTAETVSYPDVEKFAAFAQEKGLSMSCVGITHASCHVMISRRFITVMPRGAYRGWRRDW